MKRSFVFVTTIVAAFVGGQLSQAAQDDFADIKAQIAKQHDESVKRLQDWIGQVSIAAENRGYPEGAEYMAKLARDAGFQQATVINTEGKPGVFATLDAGAPKTVGLYFMYDVKQFDPAEWSSPPTEARLVDKSPLGKAIIGRGAVNQKGPEAAFLAAYVHSSLKAMIDSPAWRLIHALNTLVSEDGNTIKIDNYPTPRPLSPEEKAMIANASKVRSEANAKSQYSTQHWIDDLPWQQANERLESQPTVNIEGLVGGYTGPGGKTVLPHRAVAKIDMRLVPDMKAMDALAALKAHLAKRGFGDIEVNMSGGYDPTSTSADSALIKAQLVTYKQFGIDPLLWPRNAGSYPGYVFTGEPLKLASGHFGLGHGSGAHAPDEYYVIESANPKIQNFDGVVMSFVQYLYELAK